jgi:hypothetical protein
VLPRKIIHVDMDAFYASVEQRDNPELRGRPHHKPTLCCSDIERHPMAVASFEVDERTATLLAEHRPPSA